MTKTPSTASSPLLFSRRVIQIDFDHAYKDTLGRKWAVCFVPNNAAPNVRSRLELRYHEYEEIRDEIRRKGYAWIVDTAYTK